MQYYYTPERTVLVIFEKARHAIPDTLDSYYEGYGTPINNGFGAVAPMIVFTDRLCHCTRIGSEREAGPLDSTFVNMLRAAAATGYYRARIRVRDLTPGMVIELAYALTTVEEVSGENFCFVEHVCGSFFAGGDESVIHCIPVGDA